MGRAAHARPLNPQRGAVLSSTSSDATFTVPRIGTPIGSRRLVSHTEPAGIDRVDEWPSAPTPRQASPCVCPSSAGAFAGSRAPSPGEDESSSASGPAVAHEPLRPSADRSVRLAHTRHPRSSAPQPTIDARAGFLRRRCTFPRYGGPCDRHRSGSHLSLIHFCLSRRGPSPASRPRRARCPAIRFSFAHHRVMCGAFLACSRCC